MPSSDGALRPWRQIAKELSEERDPEKVLELTIELNAALEAQGTSLLDLEPRPQKASKSPDGH